MSEGPRDLMNEIEMYKAMHQGSGVLRFVISRREKCIESGHKIMAISWLHWEATSYRMVSCQECGVLHKIQVPQGTFDPPPMPFPPDPQGAA